MSTINSRVKQIRETFCGGSNVEFAKKLHKEPNTTSNWVREKYNVGRGVASEISNTFSVDIDWILFGQGSMLKNTPTENPTEFYSIPLLPITAQAGSLNDFVMSVKGSECERIISPVKGADFAISVTGDSMAPEYPNGSQILIKKINENAFIEWGKVYVLDTCNGSVVKILLPSEKEGCVKCMSINKDPRFAPFDVCLLDVYGIYRVLLCMSVK